MNTAAKTSGLLLQAVLDNATDSIVLIDKYHKVIMLNDVIRHNLRLIHGKTLAIGDDYREFVIDQNRELYTASFAKALNGETVIVEKETVNAGTSFWFRFKLKAVYDNDGDLLGILLTARNIDDTKRKEIDLEQTRHQLKERMKELSVVHQLHKILQNEEQTVDDIFKAIVNVLPQGWQHSGMCEAKIDFNGKVYKTDGYHPSAHHLRKKFRLNDGREGNIEIIYTGAIWMAAEPFIKEEDDLIGTVVNIIQMYFDKKAHQDALEHSETRFRSAFEFAAVGMAIVSLRGDWLMVNKTLCDMTGYTEPELLKTTFQKMTHPEDLPKDVEVLAELHSGKKDHYQVEKRYMHKSGTAIWVNVSVVVVKSDIGNPIYYVSQIENITERKTFYSELVKSEANLKSIFDNTQVGYLLLDADRNVVAYNNYFLTRYFQETEYMLKVGKNLLDLILPEKRDNLNKAMDVVRATTNPVEYETKYGNTGSESYFSVSISPILNDGQLIGYGFCALDVTNRKNMEMERQKMLSDLIRRNKDLHEFAQIVSHNIRGPLAAILGLTNMLGDELTYEEKDFILDGVSKSAHKLDAVVKEMNHLLHAKSETSEPKQKIDLNQLMKDLRSEFSSTIAHSQAIIECDFGIASEVTAIRSFLHNILYNLLSNSLDYRHKDRAPVIKVSTERMHEGVMIRFEDNGIGIDMEKHGSKIFTLNKRFQNTADGKGLGLFIAKAQVDALDGSIKVDSTPGVGSVFKVTLPA